MTQEELEKKGHDYLIEEIKTRVATEPVKFKFYVQIAEDGDVIENPSIPWPNSRKRILLGIIEINKPGENTIEEDKHLSFIPNNISEGIETADPMLNFRSHSYPISVKERQ